MKNVFRNCAPARVNHHRFHIAPGCLPLGFVPLPLPRAVPSPAVHVKCLSVLEGEFCPLCKALLYSSRNKGVTHFGLL